MKVMLIAKPQIKKSHLFSLLFQQISPKEFIFLFGDEYLQTIAFILSYAPYIYVRKVIKLIKDKVERRKLTELIVKTKRMQKTNSFDFTSVIEKTAFEYLRYI